MHSHLHIACIGYHLLWYRIDFTVTCWLSIVIFCSSSCAFLNEYILLTMNDEDYAVIHMMWWLHSIHFAYVFSEEVEESKKAPFYLRIWKRMKKKSGKRFRPILRLTWTYDDATCFSLFLCPSLSLVRFFFVCTVLLLLVPLLLCVCFFVRSFLYFFLVVLFWWLTFPDFKIKSSL